MTGPVALNAVPIKNPPAQPGGFEILISALAESLKRPQAEYQIGAATELYQKSLHKWHLAEFGLNLPTR